MDEKQRGIIIGSLIIFIGLLILLSNLDFFNFSKDTTVGGALLLVGITFISFYLNETHKLHLIILGEISIAIGLSLVFASLEMIPHHYREELAWVAVLWGAGAVFITVFMTDQTQLWGIIPGGILLTVGLLVLVSAFTYVDQGNLWVLFLAGLSITFGSLFFFSPNKSQSSWAKYLAIILMALALFIFYLNNDDHFIIRIVLPVVLILTGSFHVYQGLQSKKNQSDE